MSDVWNSYEMQSVSKQMRRTGKRHRAKLSNNNFATHADIGFRSGSSVGCASRTYIAYGITGWCKVVEMSHSLLHALRPIAYNRANKLQYVVLRWGRLTTAYTTTANQYSNVAYKFPFISLHFAIVVIRLFGRYLHYNNTCFNIHTYIEG